jgi:hypothetical protein
LTEAAVVVEARRRQAARRCHSRWSRQVQQVVKPVVRAAEPEHARALAVQGQVQVLPRPNAERQPEAQLVEQLEARRISVQPRAAARRYFVR